MATTRNQVSYGSQGSDVTEIQKLLNHNGYNLKADGIFGAKTQEAVKNYQQQNNLAVDGIVGTNTWGAQIKEPVANNTTSTETPKENTGFKYDAYKESDTVKKAQELLNQQLSNKPGQYTSQWQSQLNDIIGKIMNREKFSYDLNGDALYQQYKDQYTTQGKMAMMDTMGQAATMTGGYGNSYAQSVGQQAYQGHLQQLNDKVPELYQLALNQYNQEGQDLYNQYAMLGAQDEKDYDRHRDDMSDWQTEMDRLQNQYNTERDYDYGKWADNRDFGYGQYIDDRNFLYQQGRDQVIDSQWQKEFDEAIRQFNFINKIGEFAVVGGSEPSTPSNPSSKKNNNNNNAANMNTLLNNIANKGALTGNDTATKNMMNKEIDAAQKAGAITQQEANSLKNQYGVNKPAAKPTGPAKRLPK